MQWPISALICSREECLDLKALRSDRCPKIALANYSLPNHLHLACIILLHLACIALVHSKGILMQVFPWVGNFLGGVWSLSRDSWEQRIHSSAPSWLGTQFWFSWHLGKTNTSEVLLPLNSIKCQGPKFGLFPPFFSGLELPVSIRKQHGQG